VTATESRDHWYAVVVAGGSGTRLWPMSRHHLPKQMQALMSDKTLIAETVDRLVGLIPLDRIFISTTANYVDQMRGLLSNIPEQNFIVEPEGRGTAAAFALLAQHIAQRDPEAVVFSLASDHAITEVEKFQEAMRTSFEFVEAHPRWIAIVGIEATRPDTGLGYIRVGQPAQESPAVYQVLKYVEKPSFQVARDYIQSGDYFWNAAYYCFRAATLIQAYSDADPALVASTGEYLRTGNVEAYAQAPLHAHEIDLIDTAKYPLAVVPGHFHWSDIGNWAALHRTLTELVGTDVVSHHQGHIDIGSSEVLVLGRGDEAGGTPGAQSVVTVGLENVAVITTEDAILVISLKKLEEMPGTMQTLLAELRERGLGGIL
jgi:mannose-1-phosphate guanylyltransferase